MTTEATKNGEELGDFTGEIVIQLCRTHGITKAKFARFVRADYTSVNNAYWNRTERIPAWLEQKIRERFARIGFDIGDAERWRKATAGNVNDKGVR